MCCIVLAWCVVPSSVSYQTDIKSHQYYCFQILRTMTSVDCLTPTWTSWIATTPSHNTFHFHSTRAWRVGTQRQIPAVGVLSARSLCESSCKVFKTEIRFVTLQNSELMSCNKRQNFREPCSRSCHVTVWAHWMCSGLEIMYVMLQKLVLMNNLQKFWEDWYSTSSFQSQCVIHKIIVFGECSGT